MENKSFWLQLQIVKISGCNRYSITFASTFVIGVIAQGMGLFNKFSLLDDVGNYGVGSTITSGRWMLEILGKITVLIFGDGIYSLPMVNGLVSLLFIALSAMIIVHMFDVKNRCVCFFIGGILASFPVVTGLFAYMYTAPYYMFSLFLGLLGVRIICSVCKVWKTVVGVILIACAIGVYQAYLPIFYCVMIGYLLFLCNNRGISNGTLIKRTLLISSSAVSSVLLYFAVNHFFLRFSNSSLSSYMGISSMGINTPLPEYISRIGYAYKEFFIPTVNARYTMYPSNIMILYFLCIVIMAVTLIHLIYVNFQSSIFRGIYLIAVSLIFPLMSNFIFVMASPYDKVFPIHSLMVFCQVLPFVFSAMATDYLISYFPEGRIGSIIRKMIFAFGMMLLLMYIRFDNTCYLKASIVQEQTTSYFTSLISQIKSADGYTDEMPIVFINGRNIKDNYIFDFPELEHIHLESYSNLIDNLNNYQWIRYMRYHCGFNPVIKDPKDYETLDVVEAMPNYPDYGSIKVFNDVVIVKF